MPAFVKSSVGSSPGTSGELATIRWPCCSKYFRNERRISLEVMGSSGLCFRGKLLIRALEVGHFTVRHLPDAGADFFHQIFVVRDKQHGALVLLQGDIEGVD